MGSNPTLSAILQKSDRDNSAVGVADFEGALPGREEWEAILVFWRPKYISSEVC